MFVNNIDLKNPVEIDLTLARGLNYYTGAIIEVKANDMEIGSIAGGGRYDDLTGIFGLKGVSGVGISFGADRIFDVMNHLNLYPDDVTSSTQVLFINFGISEVFQAINIANILKKNGIKTEVYPDCEKIKKQMAYADKKNIPFVAIIGENEIENDTITIKNMKTGEQLNCRLNELLNSFIRDIKN